MNLVMFGPPGAGKGTQASRLATARGVPQISTGAILREAIQAGTELGRSAQAIIEAGELMRDDVMVAIVRERLGRPDAKPGFILDGFPRTVPQAVALDDMLEDRGLLTIVELAVPDDALVARLSRRRVCTVYGASEATDDHGEPQACSACGGSLVQRRDDREDVVRERLRVYHRETAPLIEFYEGRRSFVSVDGNQAPDEVGAAVSAAIDGVITAVSTPRVSEARP